MKKEKRFEVVHEERHGIMKKLLILKDKQTGREYLFIQDGYSGGLSPLLGKESKM